MSAAQCALRRWCLSARTIGHSAVEQDIKAIPDDLRVDIHFSSFYFSIFKQFIFSKKEP